MQLYNKNKFSSVGSKIKSRFKMTEVIHEVKNLQEVNII